MRGRSAPESLSWSAKWPSHSSARAWTGRSAIDFNGRKAICGSLRGDERLDGPRDVVAPFARHRAERDDLLVVELDLARQFRHPRGRPRLAQFIDLGQDDDGRRAELGEEIEHLLIVLRRVMPRVEQLDDAAERRTA